jgi:SET domain-containing protein
MLLIRTRVAPSPIHGLGLFTVEPVPAGTPVWRFQPPFDHAFTPAEFDALPGPAREHVAWFAFVRPEDGARVLSGDLACFMNHSSEPNTGAVDVGAEPVVTVALRDLPAVTELTCDYHAFDAAAAAKLAGGHRGGPVSGGVASVSGEAARCNSRLSGRPGQA